MTGGFLLLLWFSVGSCACLWAWIRVNGWAAILTVIAWLMLGVALHLIA